MSANPQTQASELWAEMFYAAPVAMSLASLSDGTILECNQRYEDLTGIAHDHLIGRAAADLHVVSSVASREQIAAALDEQAAVYEVASQLRLADGSLRATLSSLRVVEFGDEPAVLSITVDNQQYARQAEAAREEAKSLKEQLQRMEREMARHNEREQRLIAQIGGLCDQAGLLKSDVMRLKSLQQELNSEIEGLRKHGDRYRSDAPATAPSVEAAETPRAISAPRPATPSSEPLVAMIAARLTAFEEQLQGHVAGLRMQAATLRSDSNRK